MFLCDLQIQPFLPPIDTHRYSAPQDASSYNEILRINTINTATSWSGLEAGVTVKRFFAAQFYEFRPEIVTRDSERICSGRQAISLEREEINRRDGYRSFPHASKNTHTEFQRHME